MRWYWRKLIYQSNGGTLMDTVRFWNRMSARYDDISTRKYQEAYDATVALTRKYLKPDDVVLDFACGTGLTTVHLASAVASVHAIDISPDMISLAKSKCAEQGIGNVTFSVTTLFDDSLVESSFDVVMAFNILHGLKNAPLHCARVNQLLKAGGLFISVTDCLKEAGLAATALIKTLQFFRMMPPHISILSQQNITTLIEDAGFRLLETQNLFDTPPNLFVAAQKN
jgi:ubiquinone/menaquinone biosynthesis C-methylase UbiE